MKKIAVIFGTRPDTIKMAPVIKELQKNKKDFRVISIATAQHRQMLDQVLSVFKIKPDFDLDIMEPNQTLALLTKNVIEKLDKVLDLEKPDLVLVQGDTSTTFVGSLAAFYRQIPVGHVEAGLRTNDKYNPFPEEINRRLTGAISRLHFAPTETAKRALLKENIPADTVFVTGNTVIDALEIAVRKNYKFSVPAIRKIINEKKKIVLLTMHRRENWGEPIRGACAAVAKLALGNPEINFVFPVHLNPVVKQVVYETLAGIDNIHLIVPLEYPDFVNLMSKSYLIITDSGGIQEEGPHFGIPVIVLRKVTERPEAVKYGTVRLVGLNEREIFTAVNRILADGSVYKKMASSVNPYGDGQASRRIVKIIKNYFMLSDTKVDEFIP
jgi:UDP-N-acetylglucosamine 2-epimerase (non-hydrolysing)